MTRSMFVFLAAAATLAAQPFTSPPASTQVSVSGKVIRIDYHAPSMHGRKIFGGLVPYGRAWRAGANEATALHTEADLEIGGLNVPAGDYTLFIWPEASAWKLIVSKDTGEWGTNYNEGKDLGRVALKLSPLAAPLETYKITLSEAGRREAKLRFEWENTAAEVAVKVK